MLRRTQYILSQKEQCEHRIAFEPIALLCDETRELLVTRHAIESYHRDGLRGHGYPSEKHDTMTCFQQNVQFRIRNLRMPQVTDLRQERGVFIILCI